jgi:alpha-L-arabinofuranosidase
VLADIHVGEVACRLGPAMHVKVLLLQHTLRGAWQFQGYVVSDCGAVRDIFSGHHATKISPPISKYEYGMFIEHLGSLVYRSLWSEMLDDRKFYFPISSQKPGTPAGPPRGRPGRMPLRKWRSVGPEAGVVMDKNQPFVGDQSPPIQLDGSIPHGIRQSGLALVKGKKYTGRIYLRGTPGSKVKVSLTWGKGANDRQTLSFARLSDVYEKFSLRFTANAGTDDGIFEITGTGTGSYHVG